MFQKSIIAAFWICYFNYSLDFYKGKSKSKKKVQINTSNFSPSLKNFSVRYIFRVISNFLHHDPRCIFVLDLKMRDRLIIKLLDEVDERTMKKFQNSFRHKSTEEEISMQKLHKKIHQKISNYKETICLNG
jgi:hypothetical protein